LRIERVLSAWLLLEVSNRGFTLNDLFLKTL
jgi:hypothetical protein